MEWGEESMIDQLDSYLPTTNPYFVKEEKKYMWMDSFKNLNSLMKSSNIEVLKMKILHKGL